MLVQEQKNFVPVYLVYRLKNNTIFSECARANSPDHAISMRSTGCAVQDAQYRMRSTGCAVQDAQCRKRSAVPRNYLKEHVQHFEMDCFLFHLFSFFFFTQLGFKRRKSTGFVDISEVYTSGRYFVGPDYTFKVFPADAHFVELEEISVWTGDKIEIKISCNFQYFLRKDFLPDLHEAYNVDYKPVVRGTAIDAIKGRAADLPIDDYIRFVNICLWGMVANNQDVEGVNGACDPFAVEC